MSEPRLRRVSLDEPESSLPGGVRDALRALNWRGDVWIAGVDTEFSRLRLDAARQLASVRARLDGLRREIGPGGRLVWLAETERELGLSPEEARAVCDEHLAVDAAFTDGSGDLTRTVVIGTMRREVIGFLLSFRSLAPADVRRVIAHARRIARAGLPIAAVLVKGPGGAAVLSKHRRHWRDAFVGPWLDGTNPDQVARAFADLGAVAGEARRIVACEDGFSCQLAAESLERFGVAADLSWQAIPDPDAPPQRLQRDGAWLKAGAYYAQPFDPRTPAAAVPSGLLRIVRSPARSGFDATWRAWRGPADDLATLLDYFRFESYVQRLADASTAQRYHEFKVFNRAPGGPALRTTLIEIDAQLTSAGCALLAEECQTRVRSGGLAVLPGEAFLTAAREEAAARASASGEDVLARQVEAHGYLEQIPDSAPLRADVVEFLKVMPESLGRTLEIGSGTGRLARDLGPRADGYVCLDLDRVKTFGGITGVFAVVADFARLPFRRREFESIVANNVLEHASDPLGALRELRRVLRPGGRLYALIPLDALNSAFALPAHLWKADMISIRRAAEMADLSVVHADALNLYTLGIAGAFPSCYARVCRLVATPTPAILPSMTLKLSSARRRVARHLGLNRGV